MADWLSPQNTNLKSNILGLLQDRSEDLAKMSKPANPPIGYIHWNSGTNKFEKFDGVNWVDLSSEYNLGNVKTLNIDMQGNALIANYTSASDIDHFWFHEATGTWHFVNGLAQGSVGQANLRAGAATLYGGNTLIGLTTDNGTDVLQVESSVMIHKNSGSGEVGGELKLSGGNAGSDWSIRPDNENSLSFREGLNARLRIDGVDLISYGDIVSGKGSGGVALTINDNYGNANVTFNHQNGIPEQNGSAYRIETSTDNNTATMSIEMKSSVTGGAATALTEIVKLTETAITLQKNTTLNGTLNGWGITQTSTGNAIAVRSAAGDINARLFRSEYTTANANINYIMTQVNFTTDNYLRPSTPAQVATALNAVTKNDNQALADSDTVRVSSGELRLYKGNGGNEVIPVLGSNQSWQNVSRSVGVQYNNSTGRPIQVYYRGDSNSSFQVTTSGGAVWTQAIGLSLYGGMVIIPTDASYKVVGGTIYNWIELR